MDSIIPIFSFKGKGFLGLKLSCRNDVYYAVNVYSACSIRFKRKLWSELLGIKKKMTDELWILGGDFNAVTKSSDRKGISIENRKSEQREFK